MRVQRRDAGRAARVDAAVGARPVGHRRASSRRSSMLMPMPAGTSIGSPLTKTSRWAWAWWIRNSLRSGSSPAATVRSSGSVGAGQDTFAVLFALSAVCPQAPRASARAMSGTTAVCFADRITGTPRSSAGRSPARRSTAGRRTGRVLVAEHHQAAALHPQDVADVLRAGDGRRVAGRPGDPGNGEPPDLRAAWRVPSDHVRPQLMGHHFLGALGGREQLHVRDPRRVGAGDPLGGDGDEPGPAQLSDVGGRQIRVLGERVEIVGP